MKEYDLVFSLGSTCAVSQSLRALGLQRTSYPLDWTASPGVREAAATVAGGFAHWFDRDDLRLWDVTFTGGYIARCYRNMRTGFGFSHDFSNAEPFESHYEAVRGKYDRRIARFLGDLDAARRQLAVYIELPRNPRADDAALAQARAALCGRRPAASVDLLYFYVKPDVQEPEVDAGTPPGVTAVGLDYRTWHKGRLMHVCDSRGLLAYLRAHVTVPSPVPEAEIRAFEAKKKAAAFKALGKTWLARKVNHKLRKAYRDLEVYLRGQGIIPDEHPLWF